MGSADKPKGTPPGDRSSSVRLLRVISEALGKPESYFFDQGAESYTRADVIELVEIYKNLKQPSDRRYLMAVARSLISNK